MKIIRINAIWCPACLIMKKDWIKIEKKYSDITYIDYDIDYDEEETEIYNIGNTLPVTIIEKNNKEICRINGEKNYKELDEIIGEVYEKNNN